MTANTTEPDMQVGPQSTRLGPVLLGLVGGAAIFVLGTPYFQIFEYTNDSPAFNGALTIGLGLMAWSFRHKKNAYAAVSFGLFVAAAAMWSMVIGPFNWIVTANGDTAEGAFQDKLAQFLAVVPVIMFVMWAAGRSRRSLYLVRGNVSRWLSIGAPAVVLGAVVITLIALNDGADVGAVAEIAPWILVFAALNAIMEELWFRGVFLRPYTDHLGAATAVGVTAVVFGIAHVEATYISDARQIPFALLVVALGVLLAWIMRWARSIWGAVLVHVALDLVVALEFVEVT